MENSLKFTVPERCDGMNVKSFLKKECDVSSRIITQLKGEKDGILRNGEKIRTIDILKAGDSLTLNLSGGLCSIKPVRGNLDILFEDDYLLCINKSPKIPVHPTKIYQDNTLGNYISLYMRERGESYVFRPVNRLDKDTSGIVIIAKNSYAATFLAKHNEKKYYCICKGDIAQDGVVDAPIGLKPGHTVERAVIKEGKRAVTHYRPIKRFGDTTLLEVWLETGRTHQIRCHLSYIGHPLEGDDMYGGSLKRISRQALHCKSIRFTHPVSKESITLDSPLPADILCLL